MYTKFQKDSSKTIVYTVSLLNNYWQDFKIPCPRTQIFSESDWVPPWVEINMYTKFQKDLSNTVVYTVSTKNYWQRHNKFF